MLGGLRVSAAGGCAGPAGCPYRLPPRGGPSLGRPDKGEVGALPCRGTSGAARVRRESPRLWGKAIRLQGLQDSQCILFACLCVLIEYIFTCVLLIEDSLLSVKNELWLWVDA